MNDTPEGARNAKKRERTNAPNIDPCDPSSGGRESPESARDAKKRARTSAPNIDPSSGGRESPESARNAKKRERTSAPNIDPGDPSSGGRESPESARDAKMRARMNAPNIDPSSGGRESPESARNEKMRERTSAPNIDPCDPSSGGRESPEGARNEKMRERTSAPNIDPGDWLDRRDGTEECPDDAAFLSQIERYGRLVFSPVGDSMLPLLRGSRDVVVLARPQGPLRPLDVALYRDATDRYVLHRVVRLTPESVIFWGDGRICADAPVAKARVLAVMTAFYRNDRRIDARNRGYRLYARGWYALRRWRRPLLRAFRRLAAARALWGGARKSNLRMFR